ncbi:MAG TPA: NAD(P)H-dependent oxidoreductase subunit E [Pseudomonadales bacterium]|nr:NAD(P)H-dependent oxidoreductase subunit E [Pseudomonadales bacterium]
MSEAPHDTDRTHIVAHVLATTPPSFDRLLPALLEIQRSVGFVPPQSIAAIADHFNLSRADVHGVVSFYDDLRTTPPGRHIVQICQAEACQALGCRELTTHAEQRLGIALGDGDANVTLVGGYCFGNCACGPTVRIGDTVHGRVTPHAFDVLIDALPQSE